MDEQNKKSMKTFHLFNCDRTFSLDIVAELLNAVEDRLPFSFSVEKHPFSLPRMRDLSREVSTLNMDFAIFVVHAHESRLSINEEKAGIGYAVLYKALLRATDNKVLIVIGGDDNYKNRDEEDTQVLSRWAKHKITSQFTMDFLDGSTSFVLSWETKHRPIHEEALLHLLLPGNQGKKFQPKPPPKVDHGTPSESCKQHVQHKGTESEPPTVQEDVIFVGCELEAGTRSGAFQFYDAVRRKLGIKYLCYKALDNSVTDAVMCLSRNTAKYCVIIVDLKNIEKDLPQHCYLYRKLLQKAKENIGYQATGARYVTKDGRLNFKLPWEFPFLHYGGVQWRKFAEIATAARKHTQEQGEKVVVVVCGDPDHNINDLYSEDVKQQFSEYVAQDLEDKVTLMTWNTSHGKIHEDYMLQILHPIARQNQGGGFPGSGATRYTDASTAPTDRQPNKGRPLPTLDSSSGSHSGEGGQGTSRTVVRDDPLGTNRVEGEWVILTNDGNGNLQDDSRPTHDAQDPRYHQQDQRDQAAQHSAYPGYGHQRGQAAQHSTHPGYSHQRGQAAQHSTYPPGYGHQGTVPQYPIGTLLKTRLRKGKISYDPEDVEYRYPGFVAPMCFAERLWETKRHVNVTIVEISIDRAGVLHPGIIEDPPTVQEGVLFVGCELEAQTRSGASQFYNAVTRKLGIKELYNMVLQNSVRDAVEYLSRKTAKYCVIIVDLKNIEKDLPQHCQMYRKLLQKAKENIGEKVVVVVCGDADHNINDLYSEDVKQQFSEYVTQDLEDKVTLMTWNTSHDKIHEDYMLQILHPFARQNQGTDASTAPINRQPNRGRPLPTLDSSSMSHSGEGGQGMTRMLVHDDPLRTDRVEDERNIVTNDGNGNLQDNSRPKHDAQDPRFQQQDQRSQIAQHSARPGYGHQGTVPQYPIGTLLKTRLRKGRISYDREDVEFRYPGFMAPMWLAEHLWKTKRHVNVATVEISTDQAGVLYPKIIEDSFVVGAFKSLFN